MSETDRVATRGYPGNVIITGFLVRTSCATYRTTMIENATVVENATVATHSFVRGSLMSSSNLKRKAVEDTQTFGPLPIDALDPDEQFDTMGYQYIDDEDAVIYGLDDVIDEDESKASLRSTLRYVIVGVVAAAFIIGGLMVVKPFGSRGPDEGASKPVANEATTEAEDADGETTQSESEGDAAAVDGQPADANAEKSDEASDTQSQGQEKQDQKNEGAQDGKDAKDDDAQKADAQPKKAFEPFTVDDLGDVVTTADLDKLVHFVSFNGTDLSLPEADMYTRISGARVEVVHILHDIEHAKPLTMAGNASLRAAGLATMLANRKIQGPGDQNPTLFNDVLWRIANVRDETFIALTFYSGFAPTEGDPLWVLMQSPYYCMSESLYNALNRAAPKNGGGQPRALDGSFIQANASLESGNLD